MIKDNDKSMIDQFHAWMLGFIFEFILPNFHALKFEFFGTKALVLLFFYRSHQNKIIKTVSLHFVVFVAVKMSADQQFCGFRSWLNLFELVPPLCQSLSATRHHSNNRNNCSYYYNWPKLRNARSQLMNIIIYDRLIHWALYTLRIALIDIVAFRAFILKKKTIEEWNEKL